MLKKKHEKYHKKRQEKENLDYQMKGPSEMLSPGDLGNGVIQCVQPVKEISKLDAQELPLR